MLGRGRNSGLKIPTIRPVSDCRPEPWLQSDAIAVDHDFPRMFEIHRDTRADHGLHLPKTPVPLVRVTDQHSRFQDRIHSAHFKAHPMPDPLDLPALVASRICHDLISPIGAIGNGLELLAMTEAGAGPEIDLLTESVANANAQVRFLRIAFGAAGADQRLSRSEVAAVLTDLDRGGRVTHDWTSDMDLPRRDVRLVFLLLACLHRALAYGGRIAVTAEAAWEISATASRLRSEPALWAHLTGAPAPAGLGPAEVQFALAAAELARLGKVAAVEITETTVRIRV